MLNADEDSDWDEKKWIVSKDWDFWLASQFVYTECEDRDLTSCRNWAWSVFNFDFSSTFQDESSENASEPAEHSLCLIELLNCSDSWQCERFE